MREIPIRATDAVYDNIRGFEAGSDVIKTIGHVIAEARDINGKPLWRDEGFNSITAQHLGWMRDYLWNLNTPAARDDSKFIGLFTSNYSPANPAAITGDSSTWAGLSFTEAAMAGYARQAYTVAVNGSYGVGNSAAKATFTMPGSGGPWNIYGAFMHSLVSAGGSSDWMFFVRQFTTAPRVLQNSDVLEVTYNVTYA